MKLPYDRIDYLSAYKQYLTQKYLQDSDKKEQSEQIVDKAQNEAIKEIIEVVDSFLNPETSKEKFQAIYLPRLEKWSGHNKENLETSFTEAALSLAHELWVGLTFQPLISPPSNSPIKAEALFLLGLIYQYGDYIDGNFKLGIKYFKKAEELGHDWALNELGECYKFKYGVKQNFEKAVWYFEQAAQRRHAAAITNLAICYENGEGIEEDLKKAMEYYRQAADLGDAKAQYILAQRYETGNGVEKDPKQAFLLYQRSSKEYTPALNSLGNCYESGLGVDKDIKQAAECYRKAIERGDSEARKKHDASLRLELEDLEQKFEQAKSIIVLLSKDYFIKARNFRDGNGVEKDQKKAFELFQQSAHLGNSAAFNCLGLCYELGQGVAKDLEKAAAYYKIGGELGSTVALRHYSMCLKYGIGVEKDLKTALEFLQKAADLGEVNAQHDLAIYYLDGADKNLNKAFELFQKSAAQKSANALYQLGLLYKNGFVEGDIVFESSPNKALDCFRQAAELGHAAAKNSYACYLRDDLESQPQTPHEEIVRSYQKVLGQYLKPWLDTHQSQSKANLDLIHRLCQFFKKINAEASFDVKAKYDENDPMANALIRINLEPLFKNKKFIKIQDKFPGFDIKKIKIIELTQEQINQAVKKLLEMQFNSANPDAISEKEILLELMLANPEADYIKEAKESEFEVGRSNLEKEIKSILEDFHKESNRIKKLMLLVEKQKKGIEESFRELGVFVTNLKQKYKLAKPVIQFEAEVKAQNDKFQGEDSASYSVQLASLKKLSDAIDPEFETTHLDESPEDVKESQQSFRAVYNDCVDKIHSILKGESLVQTDDLLSRLESAKVELKILNAEFEKYHQQVGVKLDEIVECFKVFEHETIVRLKNTYEKIMNPGKKQLLQLVTPDSKKLLELQEERKRELEAEWKIYFENREQKHAEERKQEEDKYKLVREQEKNQRKVVWLEKKKEQETKLASEREKALRTRIAEERMKAFIQKEFGNDGNCRYQNNPHSRSGSNEDQLEKQCELALIESLQALEAAIKEAENTNYNLDARQEEAVDCKQSQEDNKKLSETFINMKRDALRYAFTMVFENISVNSKEFAIPKEVAKKLRNFSFKAEYDSNVSRILREELQDYEKILAFSKQLALVVRAQIDKSEKDSSDAVAKTSNNTAVEALPEKPFDKAMASPFFERLLEAANKLPPKENMPLPEEGKILWKNIGRKNDRLKDYYVLASNTECIKISDLAKKWIRAVRGVDAALLEDAALIEIEKPSANPKYKEIYEDYQDKIHSYRILGTNLRHAPNPSREPRTTTSHSSHPSPLIMSNALSTLPALSFNDNEELGAGKNRNSQRMVAG